MGWLVVQGFSTIALPAHAMETKTYNSHYNSHHNSHYNHKPRQGMVWNRNSDHIQDMWFCKRRECSQCAPIASNNQVCPKGHSKQHYFGGTIAQWRGKWGLSPKFRVEPWQYNHQQGKKGNKSRDNQLENLRKQLQEEKAANAKLKGIPEEPTSMEVDQGMGEKSQQARKQEEAERNKKRISLAKKLTDTEWVLQWTKERQLPGTEGIQGSIDAIIQEMASLQQEEISSKTPWEQMQRANKAATAAEEALAAEERLEVSLQEQADRLAEKQDACRAKKATLKQAHDQAQVAAAAASARHTATRTAMVSSK